MMEDPMTDNFFIARIFQMCQDGQIEWAANSEGGLVTQVNGVDIRIIGGGETSWIYIVVSGGFRCWSFREPLPHISEAPGGRFISWIRKCFGLPPLKGPQKDSDKINSEMRANLIAIKDFAINQVLKRYERDPEYNKEKQELFQQVVYGEVVR